MAIDILDFLDDNGRTAYHHYRKEGQRIGQAFMNAAPPDVWHALNGTIHDPFHSDSAADVIAAMEWATQ